jgi:VanZ family protein
MSACGPSCGPQLRERLLLVSLALIVVYDLDDEFHQSFVPSRTGTFYDSLMVMVGGFADLIFVWSGNWLGRASNSPV